MTTTAASRRNVGASMNPFWTAVCGSMSDTASPPIAAKSLRAATAAAFRLAGQTYGFRRPRELIDLDGRFRHFEFEEQRFVAKRTRRMAALREVRNSRQAARRLVGNRVITPVVPTRLQDEILVSEDIGPSLAHNPTTVSQLLPWQDLVERIDALLDAGIEWTGFLPRNVIPTDDGRLALIDWESCRFTPNGSPTRGVDQLTLLFWSLGWAGHYGVTCTQFQERLRRDLDLTVSQDALDEFEQAYANLVGPPLGQRQVRQRCSEATITTESPAPNTLLHQGGRRRPTQVLSRAEVGQLLDELLPPRLSVVYTFASHQHLHSAGHDAYESFISLVSHLLVLATPCHGFEHDHPGRRRLLQLLLGAITTVLLEQVDPAPLLKTSSQDELLVQLRDTSCTFRGLLDLRPTGSEDSTLQSPAVTRFVDLSAGCLGVSSGSLTSGLAALAADVVAMVHDDREGHRS